MFVIKTSSDDLQVDGVDNGVYGDNVGDSPGYKFRGNEDVVNCLENLETWNSRWGKAALSRAALRKLEVPTWHITINCIKKYLCIANSILIQIQEMQMLFHLTMTDFFPCWYHADSPQRPCEGSGDHLRCCLSSESLRLVGPSLFKY